MMVAKKLSQKQERILEFLAEFQEEKGYSPSIRDIQNACGISSTSVVDYNLAILEREGYIRRDRTVARGIELLPNVRSLSTSVPVVGTIAAGAPIPVPAGETWSAIAGAESIDIPGGLLRGRQNIYALKVKGTSMIDALIHDGDIVLMEPPASVEDGDMVAVWLKGEGEVTLKKLYREKNRIRLQPANSLMQPIYTGAENVEVQGKVVGVIRTYAT